MAILFMLILNSSLCSVFSLSAIYLFYIIYINRIPAWVRGKIAGTLLLLLRPDHKQAGLATPNLANLQHATSFPRPSRPVVRSGVQPGATTAGCIFT